MTKKFGRRLRSLEQYGYEFDTEFEIESYLKYNGNSFTRRFDANSYLYVTKAMDYFDLSRHTGSLAAAFANSEDVKFLVVSFTSDLALSELSQQRIGKRVDGRGRRCYLSRYSSAHGGMMPFCWKSRR